MINGAHAILYSRDAERDRAFLRDVLELRNVDVGGGWLIFALPPSEVAVHPSDGVERHELYFMTDDIAAFGAKVADRGVACSPLHEENWGTLTMVTLPGGGQLGIYQAKHARPSA